MSNVDCLHDEIQYYKQEALGILRLRFSDEQIHDFCTRFINAPEDADMQKDLENEGYPEDCFFALISLCSLMYLEKNTPPTSDYNLPAEDAANLIRIGFNAMLGLIEAGHKPAEIKALTRLKQILNQPKKRTHRNMEKEEIWQLIDQYKENHDHLPKNIKIPT